MILSAVPGGFGGVRGALRLGPQVVGPPERVQPEAPAVSLAVIKAGLPGDRETKARVPGVMA